MKANELLFSSLIGSRECVNILQFYSLTSFNNEIAVSHQLNATGNLRNYINLGDPDSIISFFTPVILAIQKTVSLRLIPVVVRPSMPSLDSILRCTIIIHLLNLITMNLNPPTMSVRVLPVLITLSIMQSRGNTTK